MMVYSGLIVCHVDKCKFVDCKWEFTGPAANTLNFMIAIYKIGDDAAQMITQVFETIKKAADGQPPKPLGSVSLN
jgi:hypothetical protein